MLVMILASALISLALSAPAWWFARRRNSFYPWEPLLPAVPGPLWVLLTYLGIGPQSLGNLVEVPLVIAVFAALTYLRAFCFQGWGVPRRTGAAIMAALVLLVPLVTRMVFPMMPE